MQSEANATPPNPKHKVTPTPHRIVVKPRALRKDAPITTQGTSMALIGPAKAAILKDWRETGAVEVRGGAEVVEKSAAYG